MSYVALYRKFRPATFEDVKGQDAIVRALRNQVKAGRVGHAYLFCGTRGTGKTSVAKIMAKAVNCEHPVNGSPCGVCPVCRSIADGSSMNVSEIDAASNNGVDNVRDLKEQVAYAPTEGNYKVFIIDEVHMLSASAFNALLKTLEEPPSYVIFILATTEPHRIPVTILSRCQRYDFKRIPADVIRGRLADLTQREGVDAQPQALEYLARTADGSMRDALSLLDQCISFYPGETLTYDGVLRLLGAVDESVFGELLEAVRHEDVTAALSVIDRITAEGRDLTQFTADFAGYLRNLLIIQSGTDADALLIATEEKKAQLSAAAQMLSAETLIRYIRIFSALESEMRYASSKRLQLEVAVIKLCRPQTEQSYDSLIARIGDLENKVERLEREGVRQSPPAPQAPAAAAPARTAVPEKKKEAPKKPARPIPEDIRTVAARWGSITGKLSRMMQELVRLGHLSTDEEACRLMLVFEDGMAAEYVRKNAEEIEEQIEAAVGKKIPLFVELNETGETAGQIDLEKLFPGIEIEIEED